MTQRFYAFYFIILMGVLSGFTVRADVASNRKATDQFLQQIDKQRTTDPAAALQAVQQFQTQHADMVEPRQADLTAEIATIYFENLKDTAKALATLDAGIAKYKSPRGRLPLITQECIIISKTKGQSAGIAYFKEELPQYLADPNPNYFAQTLPLYSWLVKTGGKPDDMVLVLRQAITVHPGLIENERVGAALAENLLGVAGHEAEALGYAKLYWMTCNFDEKSINTGASILQKVWMAKDLNAAQGNAFLKAMQDNSAANPLKEAAPATVDAAAIQNEWKVLPANADHERITLLLLQGKYGDAMLVARRMLLDNPTGDTSNGALEIARVFKAADLNLVQANAFLKYFKDGQGDNPLDAFFKQYPAGTASQTAPVATK